MLASKDGSGSFVFSFRDGCWLRRSEARSALWRTRRFWKIWEEHFGGYTVGPSYQRGIGRRGETMEANVHRVITVLASRWRGSWRYFKALRQELEACSGEDKS
jgi:hypothetical protein